MGLTTISGTFSTTLMLNFNYVLPVNNWKRRLYIVKFFVRIKRVAHKQTPVSDVFVEN